MKLHEGLGFKHLSHQEQQAYKIILKAFSTMAMSFNCSQINRSVDLMKIIQTVLGDNPSVIYFDKTQIETEVSVFYKRINLTTIHSKSQIKKMSAALDEKANRIISSVIKTSCNDEYSLLTSLYNSLQKNIQYDTEEFNAILRGKSKILASHNAYGAIMNRTAVCDGYSSAFALLAQKLGFECTIANGRSAYLSRPSVNHAWNIIKLQGKFYHMDITWDAAAYNEFGEYSYDYFALNDEEIANDHDWDKATTPACLSSDYSYYLKNGLYATNRAQLNTIIKAYGNKQADVLRIKLSSNIPLPKKAGEYLAQKVIDEIVKYTKCADINYGWNESTRCFFAKRQRR